MWKKGSETTATKGRASQLAEKLCTGQESSTSGAKALIAEIRYGPAKAVP